MRKSTYVLVLACVTLACPGLSIYAKSEQKKAGDKAFLQLDVRRVPIDVVVQDKNGNPVRGLKKDDFVVQEDGKDQRVLSFEWMDGAKPTILPKVPNLPVNTFINVPSQPEHGPLYILYYDLVNTEQQNQMLFRKQLLDFVQNAPPGVRIALFINAKGLHLLQGFTTDHALLRQAILRKGDGPHIPNVFIYAENFGKWDAGGALSNLTFLAEYLEGIPGRKNLLWLADVFPIPVAPSVVAGAHIAQANQAPQLYSLGSQGGPEVLDLSELLKKAVQQTYASLMRSRVALYPVHLGGVSGAESLDEGADALGYYQILNMIAESTGGRAFYSSNRIDALLDRAIAHGESYYTLTYAPTNTDFNGEERHISIKLAHKRDYRLTYRQVYYAVSDEESQKHKGDPLQDRFVKAKSTDTLYANIEHGAPMMHDLLFSAHLSAMGEPQLATPAQMQALESSPDYFQTRKKHPNKVLTPVKMQKFVIDYGVIDPQLRATINGKQGQSVLEFAAAAYNNDGKLLNSMLNQGVPSGQKPEKTSALFHAIQELDAPPGTAFIRLAVRDMVTNRTGTLEVPLPLKAENAVASK